MRLVRVGKRAYAIGLWWQMTKGSEQLRKQAQAANDAIHGSFTRCVLLPQQIGLAETCPKSTGVPSLAAAVAQKRNEAQVFVCRFPMHGLFWVCACKEGLVAAEGDRYFDKEEEALAHAENLALMLDVSNLQQVQNAAELLPNVSRLKQCLQRLFPYAPVVPLASPWPKIRRIGYVLLAVLAVLLFRSIDFQNESSDIGRYLEARRAEILAHPERFFPRPWLEQPSPEDWGGTCLGGILKQATNELGWDLTDAVCTGKSLVYNWKFSSSASFLHLPKGASLLTPTQASRKVTLPELQAAKERPLISKDHVARTLYELSRVLGLHLNLNWKDKEKREVREGSLVVNLTAPWYTASFSIDNLPSMTVLDRELYQALGAIPGLVLTELSFANGQWKLTGLCHAN
ncbi:MAG: type 4b pilus protein PilO2 [Desulfovibrio sp.]|nr:type 4b pilus protein PilO2 [Desulfovibrio sp.]